VLNEGMRLDDDEIERFARYVFGKYPAAGVISFHAVDIALPAFPYPHQRFNCTEDIILDLPSTADEYLASLGKNMRRNVKRYMDKLKRDFPSFRYDIHDVSEGAVLDERQLRAIIGFSRARIAGKNKAYAMDDEEVDRVIALTKACGMVGVASIDGQVCGGAIGYRVGDNYFFKVISHDPRYNDYSTGILCTYLTICACIARGCRQYNFMQDGYDYKYALGAVPRALDHLSIYRSRMHMIRHGGTALKAACDGYKRRAKLRFLELAGNDDNAASHLIHAVRRMTQIASGLLARNR
jgi:hypothetical protein